MPGRFGGSGEIVDQRLPVPDAEAEALAAKVDQMVEQLDVLIADRAAGRAERLASWEAPNRGGWEEDFHYSQTDLFTAIDSLQWFKGRIDGVVDAVREHNRVIPGDEGADGGGGGSA
jgi:hypothetical protein